MADQVPQGEEVQAAAAAPAPAQEEPQQVAGIEVDIGDSDD